MNNHLMLGLWGWGWLMKRKLHYTYKTQKIKKRTKLYYYAKTTTQEGIHSLYVMIVPR